MKTLDEKINQLKINKHNQTQEKIKVEGSLDEDDYGRIVPPKGLWNIIPNNEDGSFYGYKAWTDNFCSLMSVHPVYVNSDDAFTGRWMYFMSKMRPNKWNPKYPYDHLKGNIEKYNIICGIGDDAHFAPDFKKGLDLGWKGLLDEIEKYEAINNAPEQIEFYEYHKRAIKAIQGWIKRHIDKAIELANSEDDEQKRDDYLQLANVNKNILENPPVTFREACQWMIWYHLASRTYNRDGAGGQLDSLLLPYYENDLKKGLITRELAVYYLACFLISDPVYWQLGGPDENGNDQTSEMSFMILEAGDKINTSLNLTVRVYDGLNPELLRKSVEYLVKNKNGWPRFSGDKALVEGFVKNGFTKELARKRIAVGCNWMSLPGLEYTMNDLVKVNMAKVFEVAYQEMTHGNEASSDKLWQLFEKHLKIAVKTAAEGIRHHLAYQKYNEPELLLNLLSYGPLEKGRDASDDGARYYNLAIDGAGLAIVADSFSAIEQRIEKEHKLSFDDLKRLLESNFDGAEGRKLRLVLSNSQRYGASNSIAEKWALKIRDSFTKAVKEESEPEKRRVFIPGFFSWANTIQLGKAVGATPNGRYAQTPISHGANPCPGFVKDGASLALARIIALIQPGYGNTAPMQWELDPSFAEDKNIDIIVSIIKSHFMLGGTLINVNILDKNVILEANEDPMKYPDLIVRVTGFTAYFCMLTPQFRKLVVDRILEN